MNLKKLFRAFIILTFFGGLFLLYCHLESRWIKTKRFNLISKDIPQSFIGKKIVFITDIHHGPFFSIERVQKLVERINKLNPDYIIMEVIMSTMRQNTLNLCLMNLEI